MGKGDTQQNKSEQMKGWVQYLALSPKKKKKS